MIKHVYSNLRASFGVLILVMCNNCYSQDVWNFPASDKALKVDTITGDISTIRQLVLKRNYYRAEELPFDQMNSLEYLSLADCQVDDVALVLKKVCRLPNLKYLNLEGNYIDTLSFELGSFTNLRFFSVRACGVKCIDSSISELRNLEFLNLGLITGRGQTINEVKYLPLAMSKLVKLKTLFYDANSLIEIPPVLFSLNSLEYLSLRNNYIHSLPEEIQRLGNLRVLDLSYNLLDTIPCVVSTLRFLNKLLINDNNIKCVPVSILKQSNLKNISIGRKGTISIE